MTGVERVATLIGCSGSAFTWGRDTRVVWKLYFLARTDDGS